MFLSEYLANFNKTALDVQGNRIWIYFLFFAGMARSYDFQWLGQMPFSVGAGHACDNDFPSRIPNAVTLSRC